ncbi:acyltransferase family protein [Cupriavidus sp. 2TAF22]
MPPPYRSEIDGLRALAVLSVILFHAGIERASGGFVGVDVFFVISGYLITSLVLKEAGEGTFSLRAFYERRIRRLLPPLIPVFFLTWGCAFFLLNATQFKSFSKSAYAALGFASNWYFLSTVGYFEGPGEFTPLLHTWSLAIEEQFYFLFPCILLLLLKMKGKWLAFGVALAGLLSFAYACTLIGDGLVDTAFYSSLSRFWELLTGALLATVVVSGPRRAIVADTMELAGVAMIIAPVLMYTDSTPFPGAFALPPTIGAALIIAAFGRGRLVAPMLKSRPMAGIGLISYGLYLWHWPILVFARTAKPSDDNKFIFASLLATLLCAVISYHYVEKPIRTKAAAPATKDVYALFLAFTTSMLVVVAIGASPFVKDYRYSAFAQIRKALYSGGKAQVIAHIEDEEAYYLDTLNLNYDGESGDYDPAQDSRWTCSYDYDNSPERILRCLTSQAKRHNVLVMGDSVGRDTLHALQRGFPALNFIMLHQSSCPPGDRPKRVGGVMCFPDSADLLAQLKKRIHIDAIVINFSYVPENWENVEPGLVAAKTVTDDVVMLGVSPMFYLPISRYIKSLPKNVPIPQTIPEADTSLTRWNYHDIAHEAQSMAARHGIAFVGVTDMFCPSQQCRLWINGRHDKPLFIDQEHLTNEGIDVFARFLESQPVLARALERAS